MVFSLVFDLVYSFSKIVFLFLEKDIEEALSEFIDSEAEAHLYYM